MKTIDKRDAKRLLRKVVKGREDYQVSSCTYYVERYDGRWIPDANVPNCVVGHALYLLDPEILKRIQRRRLNGSVFRSVMCDSPDILGENFRLTAGAVDVFCKAQDVQDGRGSQYHDRTWGQALRVAEKV